jgi:uncharacterized protein YfaS (alpha-2-macroglobulin family)
MADEQEKVGRKASQAGRFWWPAVFLAVNLTGLAVILWRIEANRPPESTMAVVGHAPADELPAEKIDEVTVELGVPLDPATVRPDTLRLLPSVAGRTELRDKRRLVFKPADKLRSATRYEIRLDPGLRGANGELPPETRPGFTTPRLAVRSVSQAAWEPDGSCIIAFDFSGPVDPDELAGHLKIAYPNGKSAGFERVGGKPSTTVRVRCLQPAFDRLHVEIAPGLAGTDGPLGLEKAHVADVEVSGRLQLLGMSADFNGGTGRVRIKTNAPVEIAGARQFLGIEPPLEFTVESDYRGLALVGDFRSGERYRVTLRPGLSAGALRPLDSEISRTVWFPDRPKDFRFGAEGGYLTPTGLLKVPVVSTNVGSFQLSAGRLYAGNLVEFVLGHQDTDELGTDVCSREVRVAMRRNEPVETLLDMREIAGGSPRGVYRLALKSRETGYWERDSTIVVITDLGASARVWERQVLVWVTALADARPARGVTATVYSNRRQPLGSAVTDGDGLALVELAGAPVDEKPAVVVLERGGELSYLALSGTEVTHPGCYDGRPFPSRSYEVFAFSERGAYRPGDEVRLSAFLRAPGWETPPELPLDLVVLKPGGQELLRRTVGFDAAGRAAAEVALPAGAPTGGYRAEWRLPGSTQSLGEARFLMADYLPRTLRLRLECAEGRLPAGQAIRTAVSAEHLFGDPAAGLPVRCRARFVAEGFSPREWKGYTFGDLRREQGHSDAGEQKGVLDAAGRASFEVKPPRVETRAAVMAFVEIEVQEPGGRALCERLARSLDPWACYLGAKLPEASPQGGQPVAFELAAVAPGGGVRPEARRFKAQLYRVTWSNVLRRTGSGRLEYDWKRQEEPVAAAEGAFRDGLAACELTPRSAGPHRLVVESADACPVACDFYVQGPGAGWATEDPERLLMTLDKASYRPGETARLAVRGPFGGTALVCVESDRVLERRVVELAGGQGTFEFAVAGSWRPNVYLSATAIRPVGAEDDWRPHRASGAVCLRVDNGDRQLKLDLTGPGEVRPGGGLELAVRVSAGGRARAGAAVVLAAVDEGVLSLTDFPTPDPWKFFYADRRLGVRSFDMFGRLAPELSAWQLGRPPAPGGDRAPEPGAELARRLSPVDARRVRTAVLWSGTLLTDDGGIARAKFLVPEYVGELRVMAAAASGEYFGALSEPLKVRSPLMARPSWPRFLAPGDEFELPVTVFNRTGGGGNVELGLEFTGPLQAAGKLPVVAAVPAGGEKTVHLRLRATGVGTAGGRLTARLGDESYAESVELAVRPACPFARRAGSTVIEPGQEARIELAGGFLPRTARCRLTVAGSPTVELAGAVDYLLEYPYGCLEQTTSRLVPLIYLPELAAGSCPGSVEPQEVEELLRAGWLRLRTMQTHGGGLAGWPGGAVPYDWGSIYAADLLTEARKAGYAVPEDLLDPLLAYLRSNLEGWVTAENGGRQGLAAYGAYVLARAGKPPYAWLARLEETLKDGKAASPVTARFHLGAAMLAAGQAQAAREFLGDARPGGSLRQSGGYLDSPVREAAIALLVLLDVDPESAQVPALAERLRKSVSLGRWGTTQENAFALMALGKHARRFKAAGEFKATATLPDGSTREFSSREGLSLSELEPGQSVLVRSGGGGKLWAFWSAEGVPQDGKVAEEDSGLVVRRSFLDRQGNAVASGRLVQGELYRVELTVESRQRLENLVITDLLPAGLEIENPDLRGTAEPGVGPANDNWRVGHVERRDDRLLIFGDLYSGRGAYSYMVRAVTAGRFALPAAEAACMYDPGSYSVHGAGFAEVGR